MTKKPTSLSAALARKAAEPPPPPDDATDKRTLTLRLPPVVHEQLRELSFLSRRSQHALLLEGLNLVFERYGKPPIAS